MRALDRLARRPWVSLLLVALCSIAANGVLTLLVHTPLPAVHDEFSNLLAADTFAHGRLTNPTHPLSPHFESWHILQRPSYQSKYPPAQGLLLAAGRVLFGHPLAGVWIGLAGASAAVCWMLQAWVGRRWALLGGFLVAINPGMITAWGQTYWGGAAAMLGGALAFGAFRRILRRPHPVPAAVGALGLAILANSRPYEGLICVLPAFVVLLAGVLRGRVSAGTVVRAVILPAGVVLIPAALWMGYYNFRVTGDPFRMPYSVWKETYSIRPSLAATLFFWEKPEVSISAEELVRRRNVARNQDLPDEVTQHAVAEQFSEGVGKWRDQWKFYLGPVLTVPLIMLPAIVRRRWTWLAIVSIVAVQIALVLQQNRGYPHYTAPAAGLMMVVVIESMRRLRLQRFFGVGAGEVLVRAIPVAAVIASVHFILATWTPLQSTPWDIDRARLQRQLEQDGDCHLVIVRYGPRHDLNRELVYNGADIDGSKVVWARGLGLEEDRRLVRYFGGRKIWVLDADQTSPANLFLTPWTGPVTAAGGK